MRKILFVLVVLCACGGASAASGFTYFWTIKDADTVTKTKWKANNDSVLNWAGRIADTISGMHAADSIKTLVNDSMKTRSVRVVKIKADSAVTADSAKVRAMGGIVTIDTVNIFGTTSLGTISTANNGRGMRFKVNSGTDHDSTAYGFTTYSGSYADRVTILQSGKVGFGTTKPTEQITVKGNISDTGNIAVSGTLTVDSIAIPTVKSFPCSLFDNATYKAEVTATYKSVAGIVSITIPNLIGTLSGGPCYIRTIPSDIRPANSKVVPCIVIDNGTLKYGTLFLYNQPYFTVSDILGTGVVTGVCGISGITCIFYNLY